MSRVKRVLEGHEAVTTASVNLATETALVRVLLPPGRDSSTSSIMSLSSELAQVCPLHHCNSSTVLGYSSTHIGTFAPPQELHS